MTHCFIYTNGTYGPWLAESYSVDQADLLPALKGWFFQPLTGGSLVPPIYSGLYLSFEGQSSPRSQSSRASTYHPYRLISLSHPRPKGARLSGCNIVPLDLLYTPQSLWGCFS